MPGSGTGSPASGGAPAVVSRSIAMVEATMALFAFYHCNGGSLTPALVA
jgi:hypothetical protein